MQCNGTDSQESPINNNNLNREIERLIANDTEEKLKGYGFMKRLKKRWEEEFSDKIITVPKASEIMQVHSRKKEKEAEIYKIHHK